MLTFMFSASQSQGASVTKEPALHYQGASVTQEPFRYSLFLEEVLTSRSIFGTLRGNWWHFLVLYTFPVYPLSVWCFGEVEKSFFLGITEMLSCNAMAPALSGGHCVTYCIRTIQPFKKCPKKSAPERPFECGEGGLTAMWAMPK